MSSSISSPKTSTMIHSCWRLCQHSRGRCPHLCYRIGCDFILYKQAEIPQGEEPTSPIPVNITRALIGLWRWDPEGNGCRDISQDFDGGVGVALTTARVGSSLALVLSIVAICLMGIDLLCCRFPCSRMILANLLLFACFAQCLTFVVYAGDACRPSYKTGPYPCQPQTGTYLSIAATIIFFLTCILSCYVPKPVPMLKRVIAYAQSDESDPLCFLCTKKEEEEEAWKRRKGARASRKLLREQ